MASDTRQTAPTADHRSEAEAKPLWKKLVWFVALWFASVTFLGVVGMVIKFGLGT